MLDFGWAELLIIVAVAVFVIGPKDIPKVMYGVGRLMRRLQYARYAVTKQFDDIMNVGDLQELQKGVNFEAGRTKKDIQNEVEADDLMPKPTDEPTDELAAQLNDIVVGETDDIPKK